MRKLLTILICFLPFLGMSQTPTANAGADQTIYLTQTNSVTLTGTATNRSTSTWREVSTDYSSGATIGTPSSLTTTISGLPQGVFYFELAVTSPTDIVVTDTVAVIVDYAPPPANNILLVYGDWKGMAGGINLRNDTVTCYNWTSDPSSLVGTMPNQFYVERDGELGARIDSMRQKYYSILNDGHGCSGYGRSEITPNGASDLIDTSKIYVIEWKGYFNQEMSGYASGAGQGVGVLMQCHGQDGNTPPFGFGLHGTDIQFSESSDGGNGSGRFDAGGNFHVKIFNTTDLTKSCHTLRFTIREGMGYNGQKAFLKVQFDGVTKYYRDSGQVGATFMQDWLKGATFYDYNNLVTQATNYTRGFSASLVTEAYRIYTVTDTTVSTPPPTITMSPNQMISTNSATISATGTPASGHTITSYLWTKTSGTGTITSPTASSTTVTGLGVGANTFQCKVTQNDGQTASGTVTVTLIAPPTANAGANQTITLPTTSITLSGSATNAAGTTATYLWTKVSGAGTQTITNNTTLSPTISGLSTVGSYVFNLKVTQSDGQTANDQVTITVNGASAPTIYAGNNQTLPGSTSTTLTATYTLASGTTGIFSWQQESGPNTSTIGSPTASTTTVSNLIAGTYRFGCTLTQSDGQTAYDYVIVTVTASPTANAGTDQAIKLPTTSVSLTGTATNASGTTATYLWTKVSGGAATITNSTTLTPTISGLSTVGSYVFNLKVTQSDGQIANDQMTVTVTEDAAPTVSVGGNQTIITTSATVTSTGTPASGHTITYLWTDISSGGTATIASPTSNNTVINGISVGTHTFRITVTQDDGQTATATVNVTLTAPPTINAGTNQTYVLGTTFTLTATYTLASGTTGTFNWVNETDGTGTFSAQTSAVTTVSGLAVGQFRFGCTLTQSDGQTAYDYVIITISTSSTNLNIHRKVIFKNLK